MDGGGRELRTVGGHRRSTRSAIPQAGSFESGLRRGRLGRLLRRTSAVGLRFGRFVATMNGKAWALGFLAATIAYGMVLGGQANLFLNETTGALGFRVAQIEIRGLAESDSTEIIDRIDVAANPSLLLLDADRARDRIAEIPWVSDVSVKKLYPSTIVVSLTERRPFALWQGDGKIKVIDKTGAVMAEYVDVSHAGLPLVVGVGADKRAAEAVALMQSVPQLRSKLRAAVLVAERRWNLVTVDGVEIRLPESDPASALAQVAALQDQKKLLDRDIEAVDMRAPDRMYLKLTDAAAAARRDFLKSRAIKKRGETT
jgi:cell division protein FtsQ